MRSVKSLEKFKAKYTYKWAITRMNPKPVLSWKLGFATTS